MNQPDVSTPWYKRLGPGLITACVVIGPGSIVTSSKVGAANNFSMLWIIVVSVIFMMIYMTLGAKLGVVAGRSPGNLIRERAGRWLAILVGGSVFFISAAFQSGNNIGVTSAFEAFISDSPVLVSSLVLAFNAIAISFLFAFKDFYKMLERLMMTFVALMLICFFINLVMLKPNPLEMAKGFIPSAGTIDIAVLGLIGTTFVISGAMYQAYLVQQKGWTVKQLASGLVDARIGAVIMALITIMLMSTAAAGFYGKEGAAAQLTSPVSIAEALRETFGGYARVIFCLGLFSAAYSSFLVNSMIGGFVLSDGLGLGSKPTDLWPRILTTLALLTGMVVALAATGFGFDRTPTLIAAQAVTVVGAPLVAGVLLWLTNRRDIMGDHANGPLTNTIAGIGLVLLIAIAARTAFVTLPSKIQEYRAKPAAEEVQKQSAASSALFPERALILHDRFESVV